MRKLQKWKARSVVLVDGGCLRKASKKDLKHDCSLHHEWDQTLDRSMQVSELQVASAAYANATVVVVVRVWVLGGKPRSRTVVVRA